VEAVPVLLFTTPGTILSTALVCILLVSEQAKCQMPVWFVSGGVASSRTALRHFISFVVLFYPTLPLGPPLSLVMAL
jgi:hypothetical protein